MVSPFLTVDMDNVAGPSRPNVVPAAWPDRWLSEAAVRRGLSSAERLQEFRAMASAWEALLATGASAEEVLQLACTVSATKPAQLERVRAAESAVMPQAIAERFAVVPVGTDGSRIVVASSNPLSATLERDLARALKRHVEIVTASPLDIKAARDRIYAPAGERLAEGDAASPDAAAPKRFSQALASVASVARDAEDVEGNRSRIHELIEAIFADALRDGASDLHFEPKEDGLLVRFRVDGALYDARRVPLDQSAQVVRRIKVIANLDISDTMRPQDGRLSITHDGRNIDLRVSTLPLGGAAEKVVLRVLDSRVAAREIDVVGFTPKELTRVKRLLELPEGLILVTGPTGSGKTSTLYAAVRHVHRADLNIVTVEDPIEYRIDGINQVQVNEKARMTFAASLRSILRQDPDVVLVGEMRDAETASIAVKASMTGHLVLSTLHASDAVSTLDRLYGMDIDTSALAAALKGIVGQRLVRRLCEECAQPVALADLPAQQQQLLSGRSTMRLRKPVGCAACRGTGYKGRTIVAEIFLVTPSLQRAIARRADIGELGQLARECGTITMWESGLERVLDGVTSLYELLDNVAAPQSDVDPEEGAQADVDALLAQLLAKPVTHPAPVRPKLPEIGDVGLPTEMDFLRSLDIDNVVSADAASATPPRLARPVVRGGLRVLVVDDAHAERRQLADALTAEGMTVLEAVDGVAALAYVRRLVPDAIIMEVALAGLDAVGLLQAIATEKLATRVIVRTRQTDADLHAWLRELGAEDVVPRTTDARKLAGRLRGKVVSIA